MFRAGSGGYWAVRAYDGAARGESPQEQGGICRGHGGTYRSLNFEVWALNGLIIAHALQPLDVVPVADFTYK